MKRFILLAFLLLSAAFATQAGTPGFSQEEGPVISIVEDAGSDFYAVDAVTTNTDVALSAQGQELRRIQKHKVSKYVPTYCNTFVWYRDFGN